MTKNNSKVIIKKCIACGHNLVNRRKITKYCTDDCRYEYRKSLIVKKPKKKLVKKLAISQIYKLKYTPPNEREDNLFPNLINISSPVIYKITNKLTGKCYIGQTSRSFTIRWYEHICVDTNSKFHKALKNSSLINWKFEILELCNINNLDEREKYWIKYYDSKEKGYNTR